MSNLTNIFTGLVKEGIKSMGAISDPERKALVAAELAKAVAMTGMVGTMEAVQEEILPTEAAETKAAIKDNNPKASKKNDVPAPAPAPAKEEKEEKPAPTPKPKPAPAPAKEEAQPEPTPEEAVQEAAADENEWTDAAIEKHADELKFIQDLKEAYGEDGPAILDDCVENWSEGVYKSTDDITPANIAGFKSYLEMLLADAGNEE